MIMREIELDQLRVTISQRISELNSIIAGYEADHTDDDEPLEQKASTAVDKAMLQLASKEKAQLCANMEWLDTDDGGYCDACGNEIPVARLMAVPETRYCIHCAERKSS